MERAAHRREVQGHQRARRHDPERRTPSSVLVCWQPAHARARERHDGHLGRLFDAQRGTRCRHRRSPGQRVVPRARLPSRRLDVARRKAAGGTGSRAAAPTRLDRRRQASRHASHHRRRASRARLRLRRAAAERRRSLRAHPPRAALLDALGARTRARRYSHRPQGARHLDRRLPLRRLRDRRALSLRLHRLHQAQVRRRRRGEAHHRRLRRHRGYPR